MESSSAKWISELVIFLCNLYQLFFSFFFHFCAWINLHTSLGNTYILHFFFRKWKILPLSINTRSTLSDTHLMILIFILFLVRATHPTQISIPKAHTIFMLQSQKILRLTLGDRQNSSRQTAGILAPLTIFLQRLLLHLPHI